jgi:hypothetical protein
VATTEVLMINGDRYEVAGEPSDIEAVIVGAARGSIMALAWLTDATTGRQVALNPDHVVALRAGSSG